MRDMPDRPGKWLVVPSKVAKQVNSRGAPAETRRWLDSGRITEFATDTERRLFVKIRVQERLLEDADIQGIVVAHSRKGVYVVEEGRAKAVAQALGVRCVNIVGFLLEVQPSFPNL